MTSPSAAPADLLGAQRPRISHFPQYVSSAGEEAVELAAMAGLELDDWQQYTLVNALGERRDGKWAAATVGLVCPRQNGKNSILEARELAGLFLLDEQVIVHSAHEQATASEQFRRVESLIEAVPEFSRRTRRVVRGKGSEAIELVSGARILFKTRTGGGARGFSIDLLVFDEAYELPESAISAMVPTLSARPNIQTWYASSAVDQDKHQNGVALARQRERGIARKPRIAYVEWSAEGEDPARVPDEIASSPEVWAHANPGLGIRISLEHVKHEREGELGPREFAVERLGIGDWPDTDPESGRVISRAAWADIAEADRDNRITGRETFAVDTNPDQTWGSIAVAGQRDDELYQFAVVEHDRGTGWIPDRCVELRKQNRRARFVVDKRGPAASLIPDLKDAGVRVIEASPEDYRNACGGFFTLVAEKRLRYPAPQPELDDALAGARTAPLGDAWKWSRKNSTSADISPLVACTLAVWGAQQARKPQAIDLNEALRRSEGEQE